MPELILSKAQRVQIEDFLQMGMTIYIGVTPGPIKHSIVYLVPQAWEEMFCHVKRLFVIKPKRNVQTQAHAISPNAL